MVVGAIYTTFIQRHIVIKMPEQVPQAIAKQFEAMIPAFVIFLLSHALSILFPRWRQTVVHSLK
ncbi:Phosphotransferase system cellobiose-specific component IIC [Streptococcus suis 05ZYH33]|nr:Phosphotransferase system cellobiose-specific component IIC [Streptococcus suis 05ZYH33]